MPIAKDPGRAFLESRIATQDGYLWPVERRLMQAPGAIRERMQEDIHRLVHDGGEAPTVTQDDLIRLGWTPASVMAHATHAFQAFRAARKGPGRSDAPVRLAAELVALGLFVASVSLIGGIIGGVL